MVLSLYELTLTKIYKYCNKCGLFLDVSSNNSMHTYVNKWNLFVKCYQNLNLVFFFLNKETCY